MAVDGAVTAITRLSVHLDMLVLQIEYHRRYSRRWIVALAYLEPCTNAVKTCSILSV